MQGPKKIRRFLRRHHRSKIYLSSTEAARGSFMVFYANIQTVCRVLGLPVGLVYKLLRAYGVYFSADYVGRVRSAIGSGICKPLAPSLTYLQVFADVLRLPLWGLLMPPELFRGWFAGVVGSGGWEIMPGAALVRWASGTGKAGRGAVPVLEVLRGGYYVAGVPGAVSSGADHVPVLLRRGPRGGLPRFRCVGGRCVGRFVNDETGEAVYLFESDEEGRERLRGRALLAGVPVPVYPVEFERFERAPASARAAFEGWRRCMYVSETDKARERSGELLPGEAVRRVGRLEVLSWEEIEEVEEESTDFVGAYTGRLKAEQMTTNGKLAEAINKRRREGKERDKARGVVMGESRKKGRGAADGEGAEIVPGSVTSEGGGAGGPVVSGSEVVPGSGGFPADGGGVAGAGGGTGSGDSSEGSGGVDWGALGLDFLNE